MDSLGSRLFLQDLENNLAGSLVIDKTAGKMVPTVAGDQAGLADFRSLSSNVAAAKPRWGGFDPSDRSLTRMFSGPGLQQGKLGPEELRA